MRRISPEGKTIIGTLEVMSGVALIDGAELLDKKEGRDRFELDYEGSTSIYWDSQKTVRQAAQRVFLDEDGGEWLEGVLRLVEDDD